MSLDNNLKFNIILFSFQTISEFGYEINKSPQGSEFKQSPWIKPYIELNTSLRQKAACKAEEDLPKLMSNSFFGKTCEVKAFTLESNIKHSLQDVLKYK